MTIKLTAAMAAVIAVITSAACGAAPASVGDARLDAARTAVLSGFARSNGVIFRNEEVVEITGAEGSQATVVCGEVNRAGRDTTDNGGWRFYYYVVRYEPVPLHDKIDVQAQLNDEPGAFDKTSFPPLYAPGDFDVLFGDDDAKQGDAEAAETFARSWTKFCTGVEGPINEYTLQTSR